MFGPESPLLFWHGFLIAFALTCAIEVPAYLGAFAALGWVRRDSGPLTRRSAIALVVAVNLITHPLLWFFALGDRTSARYCWLSWRSPESKLR